MQYIIEEVSRFNVDLILPLVRQSQAEGYRHLVRLVDEYLSGENRFNKNGEALFVAVKENKVIGICGLNHDPYSDGDVGRVRRLYVLPEYRRQGIGRRLTEDVIGRASAYYNMLVLKTDHEQASRFYKSLGFNEVHDCDSRTHFLKLR